MPDNQQVETVRLELELTGDEQKALRHEFAEPYGHEIRIGIFENLQAALASHVGGEGPEGGRQAVDAAWEEADRSALDEMFEAVSPRDGSMGDPTAAAMLAPHAWAEVKRLRDCAQWEPPSVLVGRLERLIGKYRAATQPSDPGDDGTDLPTQTEEKG